MTRSGSSPPLHRGHGTAVGAIVYMLSYVAAVAVIGTYHLGRALAAREQVRRRRAEERELADIAAWDTRLMADLVALRQDAERRRNS